MPLIPSEILNKRYRIVTVIGEGAYGAVYRGWDLTVSRDVAIKEYLNESEVIRKRFRSEAARLEKLSHAQLPKILDHFHLEGAGLYLVSEFVDGPSLRELVRVYGGLPTDLIIDWLQSACTPLTYLHSKNQLHLNVKPDNIRLTSEGSIFLVDTGLPGLGIGVGTIGYSPPEQRAQDSVSVTSDIYGLGASLYYLLTGKDPPDSLHRESGLEELVPAREVNPDVEPYLSVAASRALDLRPDVRFETAEEFAQALERPIGRASKIAGRGRRTEREAARGKEPKLPQQRRRQIEQRTIFGLVAVLLVFMGMAIGLVLANRSPTEESARVVATETIQSMVVAALTEITTITPTSRPTDTPVPTPEPFVDEKTGTRMVYIPAGLFRMGNDSGEADEAPFHRVRLDAYFIDEREVTNGQYAVCVEEGECAAPDRLGATLYQNYYRDLAYDDYPVIFVNWDHAQTFCAWRGARLPTEAEWERAAGFDASQGIRFNYPWGDEFDGELLNYCDANCPLAERDASFDDGYGDTAPVGSYPGGISPSYVFDMSGNVMEWVSDWYDSDYYKQATETDPQGPLEGEFKALRGGSWLSDPEEVRVSARGSYHPTVSRANLGFRCAMPVP